MSYKASLIKLAIKWTPKGLIMWVSNMVLKGIAKLTDFNFDLDARKSYVQVLLYGESESIEVWIEDFAVIKQEDIYKLIIQQAHSNKPWLNNILARIVGQAWKIPVPAQLISHAELLSELFAAKTDDPVVITYDGQ